MLKRDLFYAVTVLLIIFIWEIMKYLHDKCVKNFLYIITPIFYNDILSCFFDHICHVYPLVLLCGYLETFTERRTCSWRHHYWWRVAFSYVVKRFLFWPLFLRKPHLQISRKVGLHFGSNFQHSSIRLLKISGQSLGGSRCPPASTLTITSSFERFLNGNLASVAISQSTTP